MSIRYPIRNLYFASLVAVVALSGCQSTKCNTCQDSCDIACANPRDSCGWQRNDESCGDTRSDQPGAGMQEAPLPPPKNVEPELPPAPKKKSNKPANKKKSNNSNKSDTA